MAAESSTRMKDRRNDEFTRNNDVTVSENNLIPQNQADLVCLILKISIRRYDLERCGVVPLMYLLYYYIYYGRYYFHRESDVRHIWMRRRFDIIEGI